MSEKNYLIETKEYYEELEKLQVELVKLQRHVTESGKRIAILFEGRDTAGKGGTIFRFTQFLNPRAMRVVALPKPTDMERGQWYFQRYIKELPNAGEIVFFDRSWYNRAMVEPVMGFCTQSQYEQFMHQVVQLEKLFYDDGIIIFKFWFSINIDEQKNRIEERKTNPLKQWKLSTVDMLAQQKWHDFTHYKEVMFERTSTHYAPWIIINGNVKETARLESIRFLLSKLDYPDKGESGVSFHVNPNIVSMASNEVHRLYDVNEFNIWHGEKNDYSKS